MQNKLLNTILFLENFPLTPTLIYFCIDMGSEGRGAEFLTAKVAVQQSIRLICLSVCHNLEILLLKGSNQQIRVQFETN